MTGRVLLDTNIVIALFNGESAIVQHLADSTANFVSTTVLGELYYGTRNSSNVERNVARIDAFADSVAVLPNDRDTARIYGEIKAELKQQGRPIPENDIWIAAATIQHDLTLATRDDHFVGLGRMRFERW